jgi:hypothetical protein
MIKKLKLKYHNEKKLRERLRKLLARRKAGRN